MDNVDLLLAKDAIFKLIGQFCHATKHDEQLYMYNNSESALECAFDVLGINQDYIRLYDFCKLWEDNNRTIWEISFPDEPFNGFTAEEYYYQFENDYDAWIRYLDEY